MASPAQSSSSLSTIPHHTHPSPLLKDFQWPGVPENSELIYLLHGPNALFYLVSLIRRHIIRTQLKTALKFKARDPSESPPLVKQLMKVFSPTSLLLLYRNMLDYYKALIVSEDLDYIEEWFFTILRDHITLEQFEMKPDWYWDFALQNVMFMPKKCLNHVMDKLDPKEWIICEPQEKHSGDPDYYLYGRFPGRVVPIGPSKDTYPVVTPDIKQSTAMISKLPVLANPGSKTWAVVFHKDSPMKFILQPGTNDVDHFYLSLYHSNLEGLSFEFLMALDVLQYNWSHTDWANYTFATAKYWQLKDVQNKNLPRTVNKPYTPEVYNMVVAVTPSNQLLTATSAHTCTIKHPDALYLPGTETQASPQMLHELVLSLKLFAADMIFDYSSDTSLALAYQTLSATVQDPKFPRKQRAVDYIIADHLKRKIDLFNCCRQQQMAAHGNVSSDINASQASAMSTTDNSSSALQSATD